MKNPKAFLSAKQTASPFDHRLDRFIQLYKEFAQGRSELKILDIGCGKNVELKPHVRVEDRYFGADFYESTDVALDGYFQVDLNEGSLSETVGEERFDVVFCGEVIEHLFSPDDLLEDIRKILTPDGILILSTPNLAFFPNRLLLLFGISPLFLENSSKVKLGRKFSFLGQGNATEGHIRVFTYGALLDLFALAGYRVVRRESAKSVWNIPGEALIWKLHPSFASTNVFWLKPI